MEFGTTEQILDEIVARTGGHIVLAIPMGIGKPNRLVNALYQRVQSDATLSLKIFTALSLERPVAHSPLEQNFLGPIVERVFGDYPDLDYLKDSRAGTLPTNIAVYEFFYKTGDYLGNSPAQQHFIYSNYSHAARDMLIQGVNVLMQTIAVEDISSTPRYSWSSNPDVSMDLIRMLKTSNTAPVLTIGVVNRKLPFMPNDAEVCADLFDLLLDDETSTHDLFAPPNMKVDAQDYAISLWASTLVPDGGTLQIGIGSLGDGIAQALIVRDQRNAEYQKMLVNLQAGSGGKLLASSETGRFERGLYGCSEMFVNGFLWLIRAGIVRIEVYDDVVLQRLVREGSIDKHVTAQSLRALLDSGRIHATLTEADVEFLQRFGFFRDDVRWVDGQIIVAGKTLPPTLADATMFEQICAHCLGNELRGGYIMHGGFFLGPRDFYQALRDMPKAELQRINMTRILYINELLGHEELARLQRRNARFINTTMMVTMLGAAVSDGLDSGQMVSGVGGQYNFVAMGHALPDARSILLMRAWRTKNGKAISNVVWNYGHVTIPRHLRDIVVTEYGVADLRGQADDEVIKRLLAIADSRFQEELLKIAKANGKIDAAYQIPAHQRNNLPTMIETALRDGKQSDLLPDYPFGTDFTEDELVIARALVRLKGLLAHPLALIGALFGLASSKLTGKTIDHQRYLARMGMTEAHTLKDKLIRALFVRNL
ncbi:MAG: acetyl-CoA hydrolase/transferase family protein [Rhodocyclaceae bacterium]|nr:acetyl-CoA hydrolase/transferase family protein [Rhodocyclaceae bacterium]MBP6279333.1 acetyl-CoA hydrolase/transferase family protein [Rhodocyclaceae bacterium]